jgi:hypothetical protein
MVSHRSTNNTLDTEKKKEIQTRDTQRKKKDETTYGKRGGLVTSRFAILIWLADWAPLSIMVL